jgi:hypothetical protein
MMSFLKDMLLAFFWWLSYFQRLVASKIPDLTSPDFYLQDYLKGVIYINNPHINIESGILKIPFQMLHKVSGDMLQKICACIQEWGPFQHFL